MAIFQAIALYLNPASVEFAEDARRQGRRRTYDTSSPCQHRSFGKIGAPEGLTIFKNGLCLYSNRCVSRKHSLSIIH